MDTLTTILGLAVQGIAFAALAWPLYAWADQRLDRTHRATTGEHRD